jgi:uncharacterized protein CbrC (UPF0167 family)
MDLPNFRYHPDPIASGSVVESTEKCEVCKKSRGYMYDGPIYAEDDVEHICPWCIADGSAAKKLDACFVGDDEVPEEIAQRTPGFAAWQTEQWLTCCEQPAAFVAPMGLKELRDFDYTLEGQLMMYIVQELHISGGAATRMLEGLKKDHSPTAFVFKCLKCERNLGYVDYL